MNEKKNCLPVTQRSSGKNATNFVSYTQSVYNTQGVLPPHTQRKYKEKAPIGRAHRRV